MTLEMKALGNSCNLDCVYCYQEPMRNAGNVRASKGYDLDLMMKIADESGHAKQGEGYTVFGGEALLMPKKDLEYILSESFKKYKGSSIQTNGSLIDDDHIRMFKEYNTSVGISVDGANDMNALRIPKSKKQNVDDMTKKTMDNILRLKREGINLGIILTVHKLNGTKEKLPRFINFLQWLSDIGIHRGNIHMMEVDSISALPYMLNEEETAYAFLELAKWFSKEENKHLSYVPFNEIKQMQLQGDTNGVGCVWNSCDVMNTQSVYGIEGNGQLSNCGMVNKQGIEWTKGENPNSNNVDYNHIRDVILYQTPQEQEGCKDCPFFLLCNGYCVGSAIDGDWRNRSVHCHTLKTLFEYYEKEVEQEGSIPFSKRVDRSALEKMYIEELIKYPQSKYRLKNLDTKKLIYRAEVRG